MEEWAAWEFTQKEVKAVRKAAHCLREGFPWLYAEPKEARIVAFRAGFPRSKAGVGQNDQLLRVIYCSGQSYQDTDLARLKIVETVSGFLWPREELNLEELKGHLPEDLRDLFYMGSELNRLTKPREAYQPKTDSEFFSAIAMRLEHLENFKPTIGDYAVEALQNAFVGLMEGKYEWGKKGLPTKGEVREMAKAHLESQGKSWKGAWTGLLGTAGLGFLPAGKAGRPPKPEIDRNIKDKQEFLSKQTKFVNAFLGGNWQKLLDQAGHVFGGKKLFQPYEAERVSVEEDEELE